MLQPFLGPLFNFFNRFFNGIGFSCYTLRNIRFGDGKSCFPVNIRQAEKQDNTVNSRREGKIMVRGVNEKIIEINNVEADILKKCCFSSRRTSALLRTTCWKARPANTSQKDALSSTEPGSAWRPFFPCVLRFWPWRGLGFPPLSCSIRKLF